MEQRDSRMKFFEELESASAPSQEESWLLLIVDDEEDVHHVTRMVARDFEFEGKGLSFLSAYSGEEAKVLLKQHTDVAAILLDVVMETSQSGLDLVRYIREDLRNPFVRIILRTGQPGQAPEREVITKYDINDYRQKSELTAQKLFTSILSAVRSYRDLHIIEQNRLSLKRALGAARAADKARSQILANMSHEFRTPLNGILGAVEVLFGTDLDGRQREVANMIGDSGRRLLSLLNNLLEMTSFSVAGLVLKQAPFALREIMDKLIHDLNPLAETKGVELVHTVHDDVPDALVGDDLRLRQVLINLVQNSVRATDSGRVHLDVRLDAETVGPEAVLLFAVHDTGTGIALEKQDNIFDPFALAEDYMVKRRSGAGLGLSICREIVEEMGGRIWVESELGKGSVFSFTVRLGIKVGA